MIQDFYTIQGIDVADKRTIVHVLLNPDCQVYEGHFPGEPVAPGVCNINMIRECAEKALEASADQSVRLMLSYIQQCRLTTLVTPLSHKQMEVVIDWLSLPTPENPIYKIAASIGHGEDIYLTLKAELTPLD